MKRVSLALSTAVALTLLGPPPREAFGFADEPIGFRDPAIRAVWDDPVSTYHADHLYVMALAAGFPRDVAAGISVWGQLVDSEKLGPGGAETYTNCLGSVGPPPDRDTVCTEGYGDGLVVWPQPFDSACTTSRSGPYGPFFHFARGGEQLERFKDWAWGRSGTLPGYSAYAWGSAGDTVLTAPCRYIRQEDIETGIRAGSTRAFATFLHSLADSGSHRDCIGALGALGLPNMWGTHTVGGAVPACEYDPANPANSDAHGQEYGSGAATDRTLYTMREVFEEMVDRSVKREGRFFPLDCTTVLTAMEGQPKLEDAMRALVTSWEFLSPTGNPGDAAASRRAHIDKIAAAILAQRKRAPRPTVASISPTSVQKAGLGRDVTIVVTGSGFKRGTRAQLSGHDMATTYRSPTRLHVTAPGLFMREEGAAGLILYNERGGGGTRPRAFTYTYPTPTLRSLEPSSAPAGSPRFNLILNGRDFVPVSVVRWTRSGTTVELPTTYMGSNQLFVDVEPALVAEPGRITIQVATLGKTTKLSGRLTFTVSP